MNKKDLTKGLKHYMVVNLSMMPTLPIPSKRQTVMILSPLRYCFSIQSVPQPPDLTPHP